MENVNFDKKTVVGIIEKQGIQGTVVTYIGVLLGFLTAGVLIPMFFTQEEIGVMDVLNAWSLILGTLATLGINNVTNRLFPWFRDEHNRHNGFLGILLVVLLGGLILTTAVYFLIRPYILQKALESGQLLPQFIDLIIPLTVFTALFLVLDIYYAVLYRSVKGIWHKEFLQRLFMLAAILVFVFILTDFPLYIYLYVAAICLPGLTMLVNLVYDQEFTVKINRGILTRSLVMNMASVAFFGVIVSFSNIAIQKIDILMIEHFLGTVQVGTYSRVFFYGTLVAIPLRVLAKISAVVLAQAWKDQDIPLIRKVYSKSTLDQLLFGALVFIGLWGNIENVLRIIGPEYESGKWVVFYIGLSNLFLMAAGVSGAVISTSKEYKVLTLFVALFGILVIATNMIFIPVMGIVGAALASAISALFYAVMRFIFLWRKHRMQPYAWKHLLVLLISGLSFVANLAIPDLHRPDNHLLTLLLDIAVRSVVMSAVFLSGVWVFNLSPEMRKWTKIMMNKLSRHQG